MPDLKLEGEALLNYLVARGNTREEAIATMREHNQDLSFLTDTK